MGLPRLWHWRLGERTNGGQTGTSAVSQAGSLDGARWSKSVSPLRFQNKCIGVSPNVQLARCEENSPVAFTAFQCCVAIHCVYNQNPCAWV